MQLVIRECIYMTVTHPHQGTLVQYTYLPNMDPSWSPRVADGCDDGVTDLDHPSDHQHNDTSIDIIGYYFGIP